jgi:hypothetical protein
VDDRRDRIEEGEASLPVAAPIDSAKREAVSGPVAR